MKLTTTKDRALTTISALLHGDSGCGKTSSCLTLPSDKTLIAVGERGTLPLRSKSYPVLQFKSWDDLQDIGRMFAYPEKIEDPEIKAAIQKTRVLFIDSLSECSDLCMRNIITVERKALLSERSGGKQDRPKNAYEELMSMEDWGLYRARMLKMIGHFTHLPINVIFTCRSAWSKDKQGGDVFRTPNLSGKAALECPAHFDLVLYMQAGPEEGSRVWRTFNDGSIVCKDSSGVLDLYEETNWTKLFTKILKGKSNAQAK